MDTDPDSGIESWPTGRLLSVAARLVEARWAVLLDQLGLSHAGLVALHLLGTEGLAQSALARRCRVTDQTMSRTLDRLHRSGFVERTADPADGRRTLVRATEAGREVHRRAAEAERHDPVVQAALGQDERFRRRLLHIVTELGPEHG
ncbi:MarR family winged helix-turn-helix transcriptional regulator [Amycolatopsis aidingensis]|uniref:MarR family winged helix-turn-helix transcriptional regulator n=1 Tax=Amycolatopsis aidingensis TaxID=2842453 RepID=UPI001C0BD32B|nr:MarR family transcriptional regulator [Amycolatopsis aidingensis]